MDHVEVLLIGGRAGVGKTTVAWEVSARLRAVAVSHAVIEGDFMGQVYPAPAGDPHRSEITESNLTAVWGNFAQRGYRRLIHTNTLSVLPETTGMFERAMGAGVRIVRVLLTASDTTAGERLAGRELGSELEQELKASARKARLLDERVAADTVRVVTDGRPVVDIAREVVAATGWGGQHSAGTSWSSCAGLGLSPVMAGARSPLMTAAPSDQPSWWAAWWRGWTRVLNRRWISLQDSGTSPSGVRVRACSSARTAERKAWASIARVTQRIQEG